MAAILTAMRRWPRFKIKRERGLVSIMKKAPRIMKKPPHIMKKAPRITGKRPSKKMAPRITT